MENRLLKLFIVISLYKESQLTLNFRINSLYNIVVYLFLNCFLYFLV